MAYAKKDINMSLRKQKEEAILFFLKKYGILIDFEDDSYLSFKKRVSLDKDATFKVWKDKTFDNPNAEIVVFGRHFPANNSKFSNLKKNNDAKNLLNVLGFYENALKSESKEYIESEKKKLERFPKELLEECIETQKDNGGLESPVSDFFDRWLNDPSDEIDTKEILLRLIQAYNFSVKKFRGNAEA
jgi:hypothetical protein